MLGAQYRKIQAVNTKNSAFHNSTCTGKYMHFVTHIVKLIFRKWQLRTLEKQICLLGTNC